MLFKTGKAAGIFLKHKAKSIFGKVKQSPKRKALFNKLKGKMQTGKLKSEYDRILQSASKAGSKVGSKFSAANATAIKKSKQATTAYLKSIKNKKISSAVDVGLGATGGYLIGASGDKVKLKKSDPNYKALKRAGYI